MNANVEPLERDPIDKLGIKLISSDNHVNEPRDLFSARFPEHLKDKAPADPEAAPTAAKAGASPASSQANLRPASHGRLRQEGLPDQRPAL